MIHLAFLIVGAALACAIIAGVQTVRRRLRDRRSRREFEARRPIDAEGRSVKIFRPAVIYVDRMKVAEMAASRVSFSGERTTVHGKVVVPVGGTGIPLIDIVRLGRPVTVGVATGGDFYTSTGTITSCEVASDARTGSCEGEFCFEGGWALATDGSNERYVAPEKLGPSGHTSVRVYGARPPKAFGVDRIVGRWPESIDPKDDRRPLVIRDEACKDVEQATVLARRKFEETRRASVAAAN